MLISFIEKFKNLLISSIENNLQNNFYMHCAGVLILVE